MAEKDDLTSIPDFLWVLVAGAGAHHGRPGGARNWA